MTRDEAIAVATQVVQRRFPAARAAWLGGSAAGDTMTDTSDLDVTVLLADGHGAFRESSIVGTQPIELFVHTDASLRSFIEQDRLRRRPTLCRLIGSSVVLIDTDGSGQRLRQQLGELDREGTPPLSPDEIDSARYAITDLLDDLVAGGSEVPVIAAALWQDAAELMLGAHGRWSGSGKWLLRELRMLDADLGTTHAEGLVRGLAAAGHGDPSVIRAAVDRILNPLGGRLFDGYRRGG